MPFESVLRDDLLPQELIVTEKNVKIIAETQFKQILNKTVPKTQSVGQARSIIETMALIDNALQDYHKREDITEDAKVNVLYHRPDTDAELEAVEIQLTRRDPGAFSQGAPFEGKIKQLRPVLRDLVEDAENPGYKRAILGYWYDNILTLTAWARTNKAANDRALWIENVMEEYLWYFVHQGVSRLLYWGRGKEETQDIQGNKIYGRPINFFVRTEKLRTVSQKKLEEVCVRLAVTTK